MHDPRLLRMQLHTQLVQNPKRRGHCRSRFCRRPTGHYPIIGVPRKLISLAPHLLIKWRQKYVTEQRRNDSLYAKGNLGPARLQNRHQSWVGASRTAVLEWNVAV